MRNMFALVAALTLFYTPLTVEASQKIRTFGVVEHVDIANNELSVKEQSGTVQKFKVDQRSDIEIEQTATGHDTDATLHELKVGDTVHVKAYPPAKQGDLPLVDDLEIRR